MPAKRTAQKAQSAETGAIQVIEYGWHGADVPGETPGPFEIEVGSAAWERLAEEGKLGPAAAAEAAALKEEQDAEDAELTE